jgi:hypothetical protein
MSKGEKIKIKFLDVENSSSNKQLRYVRYRADCGTGFILFACVHRRFKGGEGDEWGKSPWALKV